MKLQKERDIPAKTTQRIGLAKHKLTTEMGHADPKRREKLSENLFRVIDGNISLEGSDIYWAARLLEAGADPNAKDNGGCSPLGRAARKGRGDICRLLAAKGADVNARDGEGETVLMKAAASGDTGTCAMLVNSGADPRARIGKGPFRDRDAAKIARFNGHEKTAIFLNSTIAIGIVGIENYGRFMLDFKRCIGK